MEPKRKKRSLKRRLSFKGILYVVVCCYLAFIFIGQQSDLNEGKRKIIEIDEKIEAGNKRHQELTEQKSLSNTPEYKEKIARERVGLVKPYETVFIDPTEKK